MKPLQSTLVWRLQQHQQHVGVLIQVMNILGALSAGKFSCPHHPQSPEWGLVRSAETEKQVRKAVGSQPGTASHPHPPAPPEHGVQSIDGYPIFQILSTGLAWSDLRVWLWRGDRLE